MAPLFLEGFHASIIQILGFEKIMGCQKKTKKTARPNFKSQQYVMAGQFPTRIKDLL